MNAAPLLLSVEDRVATLTFNRPDKLNAMNARMMDALLEALEHTQTDEEVRVVVITGAGKAFMAGADITEYAQQDRADFNRFQSRGRSVYAAIEGHRCPVIAAVNGYAFGGGLEIALACDLILAADGARAGLPEIQLNLIPGGGGTQRLPKKIGLNRALEMLLTGQPVEAQTLAAWGLVNHVFAQETFAAEVRDFAKKIAQREPSPVRMLKQLAHAAWGGVDAAHLAMETQLLEGYYLSEAGQRQIQAFYQRSLQRQARS
ncbi:MAG: enoyl-CoA hydratase/isomerase family protein [Verrucomicrobiota bacterium JB024]|nr:enoyl-CoA hydratase/isomerase family protein [Verrucomicrobiota bacterium JB024]